MKSRTINGIQLQIFPDREALGVRGASVALNILESAREPLLCVASGDSPEPLYRHLASLLRNDDTLIPRLKVVKLDEWIGMPPDQPGSCDYAIRRQLIEPAGIAPERYIGFRADESRADEEVARMDSFLDSQGPIDLAILGLGANGHIGFNEPADALIPGCHVVALSPDSLNHAMVKDKRSKPTRGITIGLRALLSARTVVLVVTGKNKQKQLARLISDNVTPHFPASFLKLHSNLICLADEDAGRLI